MSHLRLSPSTYPLYSQKQANTLLSLRTTTIILLPLLSLTGFFLTWYLSQKNGLLWQISSVSTQHPFPYLPGTNEPLIRKYTRVGFVDDYLATLVIFFTPAVSGDFPDLANFGRAGSGGFGAAWTIMIMESLRVGNRGRLVSYITIFGLLIQTIALTCTLPIYLTLHLLTSPISHPNPSAYAATALSISPTDLHILPVTIILSYLLPTYLMSLPFQNPDTLEGTASTFITPTVHQYFIALWQFFPVLSLAIHWILRKAYIFINWRIGGQEPIADIKHDPAKSPTKTTTTTKSTLPSGTDYLRAVRPVYRFILALLILTHLPTLLSTLLPPNISTILYLKPRSASFSEIYIPPNPFPLFFPSNPIQATEAIKQQSFITFPKHVLTFLQYDIYIATLSLLIWSYYLHHTSLTEKCLLDPNSLPSYSPSLNSPSYYSYNKNQQNSDGFFLRNTNPMYRDLLSGANNGGFGSGVVKAYGLRGRGRWVGSLLRWVAWCVVGGPMAVVVLLVWERDEIVRRKVKQGN